MEVIVTSPRGLTVAGAVLFHDLIMLSPAVPGIVLSLKLDMYLSVEHLALIVCLYIPLH